jgi:hypothetical protein
MYYESCLVVTIFLKVIKLHTIVGLKKWYLILIINIKLRGVEGYGNCN